MYCNAESAALVFIGHMENTSYRAIQLNLHGRSGAAGWLHQASRRNELSPSPGLLAPQEPAFPPQPRSTRGQPADLLRYGGKLTAYLCITLRHCKDMPSRARTDNQCRFLMLGIRSALSERSRLPRSASRPLPLPLGTARLLRWSRVATIVLSLLWTPQDVPQRSSLAEKRPRTGHPGFHKKQRWTTCDPRWKWEMMRNERD